MIERPYMGVCDECFTEAEAHRTAHTDKEEYRNYLLGEGWMLLARRCYCPTCADVKEGRRG